MIEIGMNLASYLHYYLLPYLSSNFTLLGALKATYVSSPSAVYNVQLTPSPSTPSPLFLSDINIIANNNNDDVDVAAAMMMDG